MKPSTKAEGIERAINSISGDNRRDAIIENRCVKPPIGCGQPAIEFRDAISAKEFSIGGLCQNCQDSFFGEDNDNLFPPEPTQPERQFYTPTENDYVIRREAMRCGSAEAESRRYHKHVGKSGKIWLVADQPNAAANVYVEGGLNGDGFGGRTLTFPLVDGSEVKLKGPWHTTADGLFADTGVDVRNQHLTFVVISRRRESGRNYESICADVLYRDNEAQLGSYHRGDVLAREWAQKIGTQVHLYSQSEGGSSSGFVKPDQVFYWERN